jgi:hypothetical protein
MPKKGDFYMPIQYVTSLYMTASDNIMFQIRETLMLDVERYAMFYARYLEMCACNRDRAFLYLFVSHSIR